MAKEIIATIGVDIDAVAGWIGSYGGANSPSDIQRGVWAGEVGTPRLLKLFERYELKTSCSFRAIRSRRSPTRCGWSPRPGTRSVHMGICTRTRSR